MLDQGDVDASPEALYVDCSADGLGARPAAEVFGEDTITLQSLRMCQQVFSAALIGHVECSHEDRTTKNQLCAPVPHPNTDLDFLRATLTDGANRARWSQDPELRAWLHRSRLDGFSADPSAMPQGEEAGRLLATAVTAIGKIQSWLAEVDPGAA